VTAYLIAYNLASCAGWGFVWMQVLHVVMNNEPAEQLWTRAGTQLLIVQSLAGLEIVHSLTRMVKSPVFTVFLQVMSRLIVLWGFTYMAPACHSHWSLLLMVGSWATVEVPRYLFYALNLLPQFSGAKMPAPLFFLRYSLFMVLYPSGISGELLQFYVALTTFYTRGSVLERFLFVFPLIAYPPCAPLMIMNMWGNRKAQYKKRQAELSGVKKPLPSGVSWPVTDETTGDRSSSVTNQKLWADAVAAVDTDAAAAVRKSRGWRFSYIKHIEKQVRCSFKSADAAIAIAKAGIKSSHESFEFIRKDKTYTLADAMTTFTASYDTGFIKGDGKRTVKECLVKYKGKSLSGDALSKQLKNWVSRGVIEPSCADAITECINHPEWMDLSDKYFVLLGATSAMGPLDLLLELGANIIAIDLDRPFIWEKLIKKTKASPGTLTFPLSKPQKDISNDEELFKCSGANLLANTPEIANWLTTCCPGKPLTIGNYTYLDGALHVQLSVACDAIMEKVCNARKDSSIAFLCTPTDVHNISKEAHDAAALNYQGAPMWQKLIENFFGSNDNMAKNVLREENGLYLMDGIAGRQGPNYALAKRMQHWRAIIARNNGHTVSSNVAPSTSTASVTSNPLFAAAYEGFVLFAALEVMAPETSSTAMLALLINDIRNPKSAANPNFKLENPMQLFSYSAFHGGAFRCPYKIGSIGTVSVLYYVLKNYGLFLLPVLGIMGYTIKYVALGA